MGLSEEWKHLRTGRTELVGRSIIINVWLNVDISLKKRN
jgi:hypothetical protein